MKFYANVVESIIFISLSYIAEEIDWKFNGGLSFDYRETKW